MAVFFFNTGSAKPMQLAHPIFLYLSRKKLPRATTAIDCAQFKRYILKQNTHNNYKNKYIFSFFAKQAT